MAAKNLVFALIIALSGGAVAWAAEAAQETSAEKAPAEKAQPAAEEPPDEEPPAEETPAEEPADEETAGEETVDGPAMDEEADPETEDVFLRPKPFSLIPKRAEDSIPAKIARYAGRLVEKYDANGDGQLQQPEWELFLLERYDRDADGVLRKDELKDILALRLAQLFGQFDQDGDGLLSTEEYDRLFVWRYDADGDGHLQPEELKELLLLRLKQIFEKYDVVRPDHEEYLDLNELGAVFVAWYDTDADQLLGPQECQWFSIWLLDANGDRKLQEEEKKGLIQYRAAQLIRAYDKHTDDKNADGNLQESEAGTEAVDRYDKDQNRILDAAEMGQWAKDELDLDGNGELGWKELGAAFVTCFDSDGNGLLHGAEVAWALWMGFDKNDPDQKIEEHELGPLLWRYDYNADAQLNRNEVAWIFRECLDQNGDGKLGEGEFDQEFDQDGDGLLSAEESDRLLVSQYDDNGDGHLQQEELKELLLLRLRQIIKKYDVADPDDEKYLDLNELGAVFVAWFDTNADGLLQPQESIWFPLWLLDADGDRKLQRAEKKEIIRYRAARLVQAYDKDKDGKLQEAEASEEALARYDKDQNLILDESEMGQWATDEFDRNRDGELDWNELGAAFVTCYDNDGDRALSGPEVAWALWMRFDRRVPDQKIEEHELGPLLWRYDANSDGQLNRNEVALIFAVCYDKDGNGQLAEHEFDLSLLEKYDLDGDRELQEPELTGLRADLWSSLAADIDSDGLLTKKELADRVAMHGRGIKMWLMLSPEDAEAYLGPIFNPVSAPAETSKDVSPNGPTEATTAAPTATAATAAGDPRDRMKYFLEASRLKGLPKWFLPRDTDGDGQVSLSEFTPKPSHAALAEFYKYDLNRDGVITAREAGGVILPVRRPQPKPASKPKKKPQPEAKTESEEKPESEESTASEETAEAADETLSKAELKAKSRERAKLRGKQ